MMLGGPLSRGELSIDPMIRTLLDGGCVGSEFRRNTVSVVYPMGNGAVPERHFHPASIVMGERFIWWNVRVFERWETIVTPFLAKACEIKTASVFVRRGRFPGRSGVPIREWHISRLGEEATIVGGLAIKGRIQEVVEPKVGGL